MTAIVIIGTILIIGMIILAWLSVYYGNKTKKLVVGSLWISEKGNKNPFNRPLTLKIEAVEKGYVQYSWKRWGSTETDSAPISEFIVNHDLYEEAKEGNK